MDAVKFYGNLIKNNIDKNNPSKSLNLIKTGLKFTSEKLKLSPVKAYPPSLQYLDKLCVDLLYDPIRCPENSCWVNLFAPSEIIHAFGIYPLFIEAFSSFLTGFKCEDFFIDKAEECGISNTLCSYHRGFLGAGSKNMLPKPRFAVTSSIACDGNINTFRYLSAKYDVPCYIIDIPYNYNEESISYVEQQLKEMIKMIEDVLGKKLDEDRLREIIQNENKTRTYMNTYLECLKDKYFPNTLTLEMYKLFATHVFMGRTETMKFYQMLAEDIKDYPDIERDKNVKRIFWVHLIPFYQKTLREYFNLSKKYQLLGIDINFDYMGYLDEKNPLESIAKKMLLNCYNGKFERKIDNVVNMVKYLNADAVIDFNHFGCKQSSGGSALLKETMQKNNIPYLSIDGDGVDRRATQDGQIRTRLEAFFEMINNGGN